MNRRIASTIFLVVFVLCLSHMTKAQVTTAVTINGAAPGDLLGDSVGCAGDVNGDGFDDIIVGSPRNDANGTNAGQIQVVSGFDNTILFTINGPAANDNFGKAVAGAGDVNGDGFADFVVGAPFHDTGGANSGRLFVYSGVDGSQLYFFSGDNFNDQMGASVSGAGDVNGDGFDDIIAGAPGDDNNGTSSGSSRVFSGADGSILYTFDGDTAHDTMGFSVGQAGDTNGDGFDDVIVGIWSDDDNGTNSGSARIFSGADGSILLMINGDNIGDELGRSVAGAGDVNRDGFDDVIVGAPNDDNLGNNSGSARVISGADGAVLYVFNGTSSVDLFGTSVGGAGDFNGDGYADLVVGMPLEDNGAANTGTVQVFSGADGSILAQVDGSNSGDFLGAATASAGDFNGDGFGDIVIGNSLNDSNGADSGQARVFLSPTLPVLNYVTQSSEIHGLRMEWFPTGGNNQALSGNLLISQGTPGGLGELGISLAPADIVLFGFLPLLIAIDSTNVISDQFFGFDANGELTLANLTRQSPFLAGTLIYIQSYEISPIFKSSNGLRSLLTM